MTETQLEEAMKPLSEVLTSFNEILEKPENEFVLFPAHVTVSYWIIFMTAFGKPYLTIPLLLVTLIAIRYKRLKTYNAIEILSKEISETSYEDKTTLKESVEKAKNIVGQICPSPWLGIILGIALIPALISDKVDIIIRNYKTSFPLFNTISPVYFIYALAIMAVAVILFSLGNRHYLKTRFEKPLLELERLLK
jgi:hypothetical protein